MSKLERIPISAAASATKVVADGAKDVTLTAKEAGHNGEHAVLEVANKAENIIREVAKLLRAAAGAVVDDATRAAHNARGNVNAAIDRVKSTK